MNDRDSKADNFHNFPLRFSNFGEKLAIFTKSYLKIKQEFIQKLTTSVFLHKVDLLLVYVMNQKEEITTRWIGEHCCFCPQIQILVFINELDEGRKILLFV